MIGSHSLILVLCGAIVISSALPWPAREVVLPLLRNARAPPRRSLLVFLFLSLSLLLELAPPFRPRLSPLPFYTAMGRSSYSGDDMPRRVFDLGCERYTPQMWMGDLERYGGSSGEASSPYAPFLLYPLHAAAARGRVDIVQFMLNKGYDKDVLDEEGRTPIQMAAIGGHDAVARALLSADADVGVRCHDGKSALERAAAHGHVGVLTALIEHGADVNAARTSGLTALHIAALWNTAPVINALLEAGADIEHESGNGGTPLHAATTSRSIAAALVLLKHGASASKQNTAGRTPLHVAAANAGTLGIADVVDLLLRRGADEKAVDREGKAAADMIGSFVEHNSVAEDVERVRRLLANAPADRAWRRRGFLAMCRAHYPSGRVQLGRVAVLAQAGKEKISRSSCEGPSKAEFDWDGVASMLMGAGSDPISLMGDGADLIFEKVVGFL